MLNQSENTTTPTASPIPTMKKELPKKKSKLSMYLVLALVIGVAFAGIGISLRQYFVRDTVAPTAPTESQASIDKIQDCSVSFDVAPPEPGISCIKQAYRNELSNVAGSYDLIQTKSSFVPGDIIVYSFLVTNTGEQETVITASDSLSINVADDVTFSYDFLDSDCGTNAYQDRTITCVTDSLLPGDSQTFTFRIQLSDQIDTSMTLSNMVQITDGNLNRDCKVDVNIDVPTESYCNETCSVDTDCVQDDHSCTEGLCRLTENPDSETCSLAYCNETCSSDTDCIEDNHSCTDGLCRLTDNPESVTCEPEEPAYCNESCSADTDCVEDDHSCTGGLCRLTDNPESVTCEPEEPAYCNESCSADTDCVEDDHSCT
ncbi:MAG: MSCRAMM family adhesin SdrC, partial [Candidatus Pacebacteria bacterium]|nr:MSCRAMM family adhesin SdrC [Candidatus Paceibacterota bacterium]